MKQAEVVTEQPQAPDEAPWDVVITPHRGWLDIDLAGVWRYRDLVLLLFRRDFVANYKQTVLGPLWYVIQPTLTAVAFTLVFSKIARIPTDDVPPFLFYMSGVVIWSFFAACMVKTSDTFVANASIFGKVYFPRLVVPVSVVLSNLLAFAVQFVLLLITMAYFWTSGWARGIGVQWLLVLPVLVYLGVFGLGLGIIFSALTTRYRDVAFGIGFATQIWMYATPIVYPLSQVPERWRWVYHFNPMTAPTESFRALMLGTPPAPASYWLSSAVVVVIAVLLGLVLFSRIEKNSMDTV